MFFSSTPSAFCLLPFSESGSSSGSTPSVRPSATLYGYNVCVICNSECFHSFLFKLCLMIVHVLKMCTFYFAHVSFFLNFDGFELRHFSIRNAEGVPSLCNLKLEQYLFLYIQTLHNDC